MNCRGKKMYRKIICTIIILLLITLSINPTIANIKNENEESDLNLICYGFIISPITIGNYTEMDKINIRTRHLINDFLREEIPVYWTTEKINVEIKKINSVPVYENKSFQNGSFIIPFTENPIDDTKIIAMIYDYNQSSEIETNDVLKIPAYILLEQINTPAYPLNNVNIALLYSRVTTGGFIFLELASRCGFLDIDILKDENVYTRLKNTDFNVLFHPGGISDTIHGLLHLFYEDIFYKKSDGIRSFVNNGGGYIGSCGGLIKASAGIIISERIPIPLYLKRRVYNPDLRSIGFSAIADILIKHPPLLSFDTQVEIINHSSPLTFGIDDIVWDFWMGGPEVYYTGENVDVVGVFHDTGTSVDGTPAWMTAEFGDGKVAIFSPHPEIAGMLDLFRDDISYECQLNMGKTVISNSLFYTTAEDKTICQIDIGKNLTCVYDIWNKTSDIKLDINEIEKIFKPVRNRINNTLDFIDNLTIEISEIVSLIETIADEKKVDISDESIYYNTGKYYLGLDYAKDVGEWYYKLLKEFFNDSIIVFEKIELINELLKNDTNFIDQVKDLIADINNRINETNNILNKSQDIIDEYRTDLLRYQQKILRSRIKENQLKMKGNTLYIHVYSGFSQVPQIYFNSLKFLRTNWYNYQTSIILE
jgi:hypothetical protein